MQKSNQVGMILLGAAAAYALYKFYQMPKPEREELIDKLKHKAQDLVDNTDNTVEKVQHYVAQMKKTGPDEWIDKLYLIKKMFADIFGDAKKATAPLSMSTN